MELLNNKKTIRDFEILHTYTAGVELLGSEVKSLRSKLGSLIGAYCVIRGSEAFIVNMYIPPYQKKNLHKEYDPNRTRRLLFHKKEISQILGYESKKGLTILPIKVYTASRRLKIEIAVSKKRKKLDKRNTIREQIDKREMGDSF